MTPAHRAGAGGSWGGLEGYGGGRDARRRSTLDHEVNQSCLHAREPPCNPHKPNWHTKNHTLERIGSRGFHSTRWISLIKHRYVSLRLALPPAPSAAGSALWGAGAGGAGAPGPALDARRKAVLSLLLELYRYISL